MEGETETDRQNKAIVMRIQADAQMKVSLFWDVLSAGALWLHIMWLAIGFMVLAAITLLSSIGLEHQANVLWPNPKDWGNDDKN
ncbi:MAG: hypothetical protein KGL39_56480 [Patescibacteria group bacterium]|nr:hypothetical protein [Patescibacteria group bacterium]